MPIQTNFTETELREIGKLQNEFKAAGVANPRENAARLVARRSSYDYTAMTTALGLLGKASQVKARKNDRKTAVRQLPLEESAQSIDLRICLALEKIAAAIAPKAG